MFDDIDSIALAGVSFLIFLFMAIAVYFLLSAPVETVLDSFLSGDFGDANDELAEFVPLIKTGVKIAFALAIATPMTYFIMWVFHREPAHERMPVYRSSNYYNRRRY